MVGTGILLSGYSILQADGEVVLENQAKYCFMSMHAEDEFFPRTEVKCTLESRVRAEPLSAHHLCILDVKAITKDRSLS